MLDTQKHSCTHTHTHRDTSGSVRKHTYTQTFFGWKIICYVFVLQDAAKQPVREIAWRCTMGPTQPPVLVSSVSWNTHTHTRTLMIKREMVPLVLLTPSGSHEERADTAGQGKHLQWAVKQPHFPSITPLLSFALPLLLFFNLPPILQSPRLIRVSGGLIVLSEGSVCVCVRVCGESMCLDYLVCPFPFSQFRNTHSPDPSFPN